MCMGCSPFCSRSRHCGVTDSNSFSSAEKWCKKIRCCANLQWAWLNLSPFAYRISHFPMLRGTMDEQGFPTVDYRWVRTPILQGLFPLPWFRASAIKQLSRTKVILLCLFQERFWSVAFVLGSCLVGEFWVYLLDYKCDSAGAGSLSVSSYWTGDSGTNSLLGMFPGFC